MKTWGVNSETCRHWWWIEKALKPVRYTRCPFTQSSPSHTFLLSLTQSMLGSMVSRATERHFSLTTVQDAEMKDISLHLRCGSPGAYSSTTSRTKQLWPLWERRKTEFRIEKYNGVKMPKSMLMDETGYKVITDITNKQLFPDEICSSWFCS